MDTPFLGDINSAEQFMRALGEFFQDGTDEMRFGFYYHFAEREAYFKNRAKIPMDVFHEAQSTLEALKGIPLDPYAELALSKWLEILDLDALKNRVNSMNVKQKPTTIRVNASLVKRNTHGQEAYEYNVSLCCTYEELGKAVVYPISNLTVLLSVFGYSVSNNP